MLAASRAARHLLEDTMIVRRAFWIIVAIFATITAVPTTIAATPAPVRAAPGAGADYPNRPVRIVVPFTAGGVTDAVARIYTREFGPRLGQQPYVIDNRPGASTNIAATLVFRAAPDGYTLLISTIASNALNQWTYRNLPYNPDAFEHIGMLGLLPSFFVVRPDSPYRSVTDVVAAAKASPNGLSYGSNGNGGATHLIAERFRERASIQKLLHVPYKGSSESNIDLIAGRIDFMIDGSAINFVKAGRLRALAVALPKRWPTMPDVPTMAEAGYPDVTMMTFFRLAAPPGTAPAILDRVNAVINDVARDPAIEAKLLDLNVMPMPATRRETTEFIREQSNKWAPLLKSLGISFD
jgi:tripartite-type tricarboxylate transporter receptor subunit TctC